MIPLTDKENKSYEKQKLCNMRKIGFSNDDDNEVALNKRYQKIRNHCHYTGKCRRAAHDIYNLRHKTSKKFLQYFITVLHIIIISQSTNLQMNVKVNLNA